MSTPKVVVCGAGFLGSHIAKAIFSPSVSTPVRRVQITSRHPDALHKKIESKLPLERRKLLTSHAADVTKPETLTSALADATVVVSLVGVMHGKPEDFERIQLKGAENVAHAAKRANAKLIHFSAIGADPSSHIPYVRTKGLAEQAVLDICPNATIIRPSLVFGPEDDFFNRFAQLARFLPFLPVFGGGTSRFQPVFVDDIASAVEIISREDKKIRNQVDGQIIEAGGPDVLTYKELMELVLKYTERRRLVLSLPFQLGLLQGSIMEQLPVNLFTVTRSQVEQLKGDNIVNTNSSPRITFQELLQTHAQRPLTSVHDVLPAQLRST